MNEDTVSASGSGLAASEGAARLRPRIALISIAAFWALYFVILTLRAVVGHHTHIGIGSRAIVSVASMGITAIFYLLVRTIPTRRLGRTIAAAALLAIPSALSYATVNYFVFQRLSPWPQSAQPAVSAPTAVPTPPYGSPIAPSPPQAPTALSVGPAAHEEEMTPLMTIADSATNGYFFFAAWAALYIALCYAAEVGRLGRRAAVLEAAARSAELRALRYQVNPHFLFNTLNSLSSLVLTGKSAEAERMILNLSTFFRSSLVGDPTEDVQLDEEVKLQRLYLEIERVRFPDRLRVEIALPAALERACVPGLILQPLVENAIKHGVARAKRAVLIRIEAYAATGRLVLTVTDDADPYPAPPARGMGLGLINVRDRLHARFGDQGGTIWSARAHGGFEVTLTMPLLFDGC